MKMFFLTLALSFTIAHSISASNISRPETAVADSLTLCLDLADSQEPGYYCEDLLVFNYSDVQSLQFAIDYNVDKIEWDTAIQFNETAKISIFDTNLAQPGNFRISWGHPAGLSSFLDDEQVLFSICYDVIETTTENDIFLSDNISGGVEATNNEGSQIPVSFNCSILNNTTNIKSSILRLYPNPVNSEIHLETTLQSTAHFEIVNIKGQRVFKNYCEPSNGTLVIPVCFLRSGTYIIRVNQSEKTNTFKFVKI